MPWRRTRTGYTALVSEFMLQQTQVSRVLPAFNSFLRRFSDLEALARADDDAVLAAWQGLGYYRRARQLRDAAIAIRDQFAGRVPRRIEDLLTLPGVGPYTAGAIASIAYGERVPIVDGNVRRVLMRVTGRREPGDDASLMRSLWQMAQQIVDESSRPGVFNEGLMELGAVVCTPALPRCSACPLASMCRARREGVQDRIPGPRTRAQRRSVHHHVVVIRDAGHVLLERRGNSGLWRGMWQPLTVESARRLSPAELMPKLPAHVRRVRRVGEFRHLTTHLDIQFHVFKAVASAKIGSWIPIDRLGNLPFSNPQRRILRAGGIM